MDLKSLKEKLKLHLMITVLKNKNKIFLMDNLILKLNLTMKSKNTKEQLK